MVPATDGPVLAERYRSGRNGGASKASCPVRGTWVRIPPSPPNSPLASLAGAAGPQARRNSPPARCERARIPPSPPISKLLIGKCLRLHAARFSPPRKLDTYDRASGQQFPFALDGKYNQTF